MTPTKKILLAAGALLVVFAAYVGVRIAFLKGDLEHALTQVQRSQAAGDKQDFKALSDYLHVVAKDANSANAIAHDPLLAFLNVVPGVGDSWIAIAHTTHAVASIANTAEPTFRYAMALQDDVAKSGTIDGKSARALRDAFIPLQKAIAESSADLATVDTQKVGFGLAPKIKQLQNLLSDASTLTSNAEDYVKAFAAVVSEPGDSYWMIATQNLAEARGTGGLFGAYAVIHNKDGKLSLNDSGSDAKAIAAGPIDNRALPKDLVRYYGIDGNLWLDFNVSAHLPQSGQIIQDTWKKNHDLVLDGVLFIGQGGLRHISAATGPVKIRGKIIDSANVADYMAKTIYADFPDVNKKNDFVQRLMKSMFSKFLTGAFDLKGVLQSFAEEPTGDRVAVWSADPELQTENDKLGISGAVTDTPGSNVWVTVNNAGGNKLDAYLKLSVTYTQGKCGVISKTGYLGRESKLTIKVKNTAPRRGLPAYVTPRLDLPAGYPYIKGDSRDLITIYAPVGSTDNGITKDGDLWGASFSSELNHPTYMLDVDLLPGRSTQYVVNFIEPITNQKGRLQQSVPKLVPPVMFNKVEAKVEAGAFCEATN